MDHEKQFIAPIFDGSAHWAAFMVTLPDTVMVMNSAGTHNNERIKMAILDVLEGIAARSSNVWGSRPQWDIFFIDSAAQQEPNSNDCALFTAWQIFSAVKTGSIVTGDDKPPIQFTRTGIAADLVKRTKHNHTASHVDLVRALDSIIQQQKRRHTSQDEGTLAGMHDRPAARQQDDLSKWRKNGLPISMKDMSVEMPYQHEGEPAPDDLTSINHLRHRWANRIWSSGRRSQRERIAYVFSRTNRPMSFLGVCWSERFEPDAAKTRVEINVLQDARVYTKTETILGPFFEPKAHTIIQPRPTAVYQLLKTTTATNNVPQHDLQHEDNLQLPELLLHNNRTFDLTVLVTKLGGIQRERKELSLKIERAMFQMLSTAFPHLIKPKTIRVASEDRFWSSSLPLLLSYDSFWLHDYRDESAQDNWPAHNLNSMFGSVVKYLTSFGHVNLSLVSLNLENISSTPRLITQLSTVPSLTTTVYLAFNQQFANLLNLEHEVNIEHEAFPIWVHCTLDELDVACQKTEALENIPTTNLEKFTYASAALHHNKLSTFQENQLDVVDMPYMPLACLAPGVEDSTWCDSNGRNSIDFYDFSEHDGMKQTDQTKLGTSETLDDKVLDVQYVEETGMRWSQGMIVKCRYCEQKPWNIRFMKRTKLHRERKCAEDK
jgi:hypothetical protein